MSTPHRAPLMPSRRHPMSAAPGQSSSCLAPTVLLLHGIATTASLCWFTTVADLSPDYRVILMDQRWHGRGVRSDRFTLADCADDTAALLTALEIDRAVVVGYSMGGALAQVLALRHPDRIAGLVLCSTATVWKGNAGEAMFYPVLGAVTAMGRQHVSSKVRIHADSLPPLADIDDDVVRWAWSEFRATSFWSLPEVLGELGRFDVRDQIVTITTPTAVIVTCKDRVIAPVRQYEMAATIPGAKAFRAPGGHASIVLDSSHWRPVLLEALAHVTGVKAAA